MQRAERYREVDRNAEVQKHGTGGPTSICGR